MSALVLLASANGLQVSHEDLISSLWPNQVVSDSSLYQTISSLRKQLGDTQTQRQYIERISGKGYRLLVQVHLPETSSALDPENKSNRLILTILSILLLIVGATYFVQTSSRKTKPITIDSSLSRIINIRSLTVLKFTNQDESAEIASLTSSLAEVLTTQLANIDKLQIIRGELTHHPAIEVLGFFSVDHSSDANLSGRVQQENGALKVNLQITDNVSKTILWAREYQGKRDQLFQLQDTIAQALVELFGRPQNTLSFNNKHLNQNAFNDYLMGRFQWSKRNLKGLKKAETIFKSVIKQAPDFALGYVGLCDTYQYYAEYSDWLLERSLRACQPLLDKALAVNPNLGEALASKALIAAQLGKLTHADNLFKRATHNAPNNAIAHMWYGRLLVKLGRLKEAEEQHRQAYRLSPLSPIINRKLALVLLQQAHVIPARKVYLRALELEPEYTFRAVDELDFFDLNINRAIAYIKWTKKHPNLFEQNPNQLIAKALISLALDKPNQTKKLMDEAANKNVAKPWLLFAKAVIAENDNDLKLMEDVLLKRMQLQVGEQPFIFPYINLLAHQGRYKEALKLAEQKLPNNSRVSQAITDKNLTQQMYYAFILEADGQNGKSQDIFSRISQYMQNNQDLGNIVHLEWLSHQGERALVSRQIKKIMRSGWLPNFYGELFSLSQMRRLYANSNNKKQLEFDRMLKVNQQIANDALD